jgi:hypothetical protein
MGMTLTQLLTIIPLTYTPAALELYKFPACCHSGEERREEERERLMTLPLGLIN